MFVLKISGAFDAAHKLNMVFPEGHPCTKLHGHTWKVEVSVFEPAEMIDFGILKAGLREVLGELDHSYLNDKFEVPTCEEISVWIYNRLIVKYDVKSVEVSEGENTSATYTPQ